VLGNSLPVKSNVVMHEAAHCIADQVLPADLAVRGTRLSAARRKALRAALGESFANAAELLGTAAADTSVHRYFYERNSFTRAEPGSRDVLRKVIDLVGWQATGRVVFLSFVLANTLSKTIDAPTCRRLWAIAGVETPARHAVREALQRVTRSGLEISLRFRLETAAFYARHELGLRQSVFRLYDVDVPVILERDDALRTLVLSLSDILTEAS
jgi:hypothetical protein